MEMDVPDQLARWPHQDERLTTSPTDDDRCVRLGHHLS
jgi:hypothetical protein